MGSGYRLIRRAVLAAITATLAPYGGQAAGESVRAASSECPSAEAVGKAMGTPVTFTQALGGKWMICQYELTGRYRGVFIELSTQPASRADAAFAELRRAVKGMKGQAATPDSVKLGEGGWAYGSGSRSQAAVVAKGRLYQANMHYMGFESIGDQKDAMVRVLELAIR